MCISIETYVRIPELYIYGKANGDNFVALKTGVSILKVKLMAELKWIHSHVGVWLWTIRKPENGTADTNKMPYTNFKWRGNKLYQAIDKCTMYI